jgi:hypothetical protein
MLALLAASIVAAGQTFTCTPTHVWDGDGPDMVRRRRRMSALPGSPRAKWTEHAGPTSPAPTRRLPKRATRSSIFLAALEGPSGQGTSWFVDRD